MIDTIITLLIGIQIFIHASIVSDNWVPVFNLGGISIGTTDLILIACLMLILIKFSSNPGELKRKISFTTLTMMLFIFIGVIGLINGIFSQEIGLNIAIRDARPFFLYLTYFFVLTLDPSKKNIVNIVNIILIIAIGCALLSIIQIIVGDRLPFLAGKIRTLRTGGIVQEGITRFAVASTSITAFALLLSLFQIFKKVTIKRLGIFFTIGVGFLVIFARGVTVSLFVAICSIFPFGDRYVKKRFLVGMFVTLFFGFIFMGAGISGLLGEKAEAYLHATVDRFSTLQPSKITKDKSFMGRFDEAARVLKKIKNKPVIGHGFGATAQRVNWDEKGYRDTSCVHNGYINITFRLGIAGLLIFVFLIVSFCIFASKRIGKIKDMDLKLIYAASVTFIISIIPLCIVQPANMTKSWIIMISIAIAISEMCVMADIVQKKKLMNSSD